MLLKSRSVGGSHHSPVHTQNTPTGAPPSRGACYQKHVADLTDGFRFGSDIFFFPFFFCNEGQAAVNVTRNYTDPHETKMLLPPNPHRNLVRHRTRRRLTKHPTQQKSEYRQTEIHIYTGGGWLGRLPVGVAEVYGVLAIVSTLLADVSGQ